MPPLVTLPASPAVHRRDLPVLLATLLAVLAWDASGLDLAVMRLLGDAGGFPLRQAWWTRSLLHDGGRGLGWMLLALLFHPSCLVVYVFVSLTPSVSC